MTYGYYVSHRIKVVYRVVKNKRYILHKKCTRDGTRTHDFRLIRPAL